jgi:anti-sigma factor RsiW
MANGLACRELVELVTEYLEGTLPADERARFEYHLAKCAGCQVYVAQMRQTIQVLGRLTEEQLTEDARHRLVHAFRDWRA